MAKDQLIEYYLRSEELYAPLIRSILEGPADHSKTAYSSEQDVRRSLDAIINLGKIIGRRTVLANCAQEGDALIEGWQRCVDAATAE